MVKRSIILALILSISPSKLFAIGDEDGGNNFTQALPEELKAQIFEENVLSQPKKTGLNTALQEIYKIAQVSKDWRRLALDPVLIKKVIKQFALDEKEALKQEAFLSIWNLLNHIRLSKLYPDVIQKEIEVSLPGVIQGKQITDIDIASIDEEMREGDYSFIYRLIDNCLKSSPTSFWEEDVLEDNRVCLLAISDDGRYFATVSVPGSDSYGNNRGVTLYNLKTRQVISNIKVNQRPSSHNLLKFSADGRYLVMCYRENKENIVNIYDLNAREVVRTIKHNNTINCVEFSLNGQCLAIASEDGTTEIYNLEKESDIAVIKNNEEVFLVAFNREGKYLAIHEGRAVKIYDLNTKQVVKTINHAGLEQRVISSIDGRYLVMASTHGTFNGSGSSTESSNLTTEINIYDFDTIQVIDTIKIDLNHLDLIAFDYTARYLKIISSFHKKINYYDLNEKKFVNIPPVEDLSSVSIDPTGRYLAMITAPFPWRITGAIYDLKEEKIIADLKLTHALNNFVFDPTGRYLLTADGLMKIWKIVTAETIYGFKRKTEEIQAEQEWQAGPIVPCSSATDQSQDSDKPRIHHRHKRKRI